MRTLTLILAMLATLALTATPAAARSCLSLQQIKAKHPGQHPRYRSVDGRQCWYVGKTPAKHEFVLNPRPAGAVAKPTRTTTQEPKRVQGPAGSIPAAGAVHRTAYSATLEHDAVMALTGWSEPTFDEYWNMMTEWLR